MSLSNIYSKFSKVRRSATASNPDCQVQPKIASKQSKDSSQLRSLATTVGIMRHQAAEVKSSFAPVNDSKLRIATATFGEWSLISKQRNNQHIVSFKNHQGIVDVFMYAGRTDGSDRKDKLLGLWGHVKAQGEAIQAWIRQAPVKHAIEAWLISFDFSFD